MNEVLRGPGLVFPITPVSVAVVGTVAGTAAPFAPQLWRRHDLFNRGQSATRIGASGQKDR
jgi:hypothetical protein